MDESTGDASDEPSGTPPYVGLAGSRRRGRRAAALGSIAALIAVLAWVAVARSSSSGPLSASGSTAADAATTAGSPADEATTAAPSGPIIAGPSAIDATDPPATTVAPGDVPVTVALTTPDHAVAAVLEPGEAWCPSFLDSLHTGYRDEAQMFAAASLGERNIGTIQAYVSTHVDEADVPWLDGQRDDPRVVIGFTAHLADHRQALRALVPDPHRVLVCQVRHSQSEVATVVADLQTRQTGDQSAIRETSGGQGAARVVLAGDQEALAAELVARYGDLVTITVGNFPYPMPADRSALPVACGYADATGPSSSNGLRATLALDAPTARSGSTITATVTLTNTGTGPASWTGGQPLTGSLVLRGTTDVVATFNGMVAGTGDGAELQPGETHTVRAMIGTDSCDLTLGYVLPPGDYDVIVPVTLTYPQTQGVRPTNLLVTAPISVTLTR